jgi:cytochrome c oxidase subunit 2
MHNAARRWILRTAVIAAILATLSLLTVTSAFADGWQQPAGITNQAGDMHDLYKIVVVMALIVFVAVESALLFFIFKYKKKSDALPPQIHGNNLLEVIWTTIPVVIVLVLFVFSFRTLVKVDKNADVNDKTVMTVHVDGAQYYWAFRYYFADLGPKTDPKADPTAYVGEVGTAAKEPTLHIPVGEKVQFRLASNDVIHSFYVRDFLYKLDVVPGRDNSFTVTANTLGTFHGQCAELCGLNHALMRFNIVVESRDDFDKYIASQKVQHDEPAKVAAAP